MIKFDKAEVKENLTLDAIFELFDEWGGEPEYTSFGIISSTICHNMPGEGSRKLYYYSNSTLCKCFTGCENDVFDIFELCIKVMSIQKGLEWDLNDAVRYIASRIGFFGSDIVQSEELEDWQKISKYNNIEEISPKDYSVHLKEYNQNILNNFKYNVHITPWLQDNISAEVMRFAQIGYYPGKDQITIPHFDIDNRFIGLRGRSLCKEEAERFGKYRPLKIMKTQYSHPLGMNLYGLNWGKDNIKKIKKAIVFESEKSVLQYMSYYGTDSNIAVAACGSSLSIHQLHLLLDLGINELIIGFDRQFQQVGDSEFKKLTHTLTKINDKYSKYVQLSFIFDKNMKTNYKDSPTDKGKEIFNKLLAERIFL